MNDQPFKRPIARKLPSGSWFCRIRIDGKDICITRPTRKAAEAEAMAIKFGIIKTKALPKTRKTLKIAAEDYVDSRADFLSPSTIDGYRKFIRCMFPELQLCTLDALTDEKWQRAVRQEHARGRSPKYIKNAYMFFSAAAVAAGAEKPKALLYPSDPKERAYLTPEEIEILTPALKGLPIEIPVLLCLSSLRRSEMLALKWENVDLKNQTLYVRGATVRGPEGMVTKARNKTAASRRAVPIIPPLQEALEAVPDRRGLVVRIAPDTVLRHLHALCEELNITDVDLHGLRHSFASLAYHLGIPELIAAQIGGWEDLSTMHNIYTHIAQTDISKRSQDFRNFFRKE